MMANNPAERLLEGISYLLKHFVRVFCPVAVCARYLCEGGAIVAIVLTAAGVSPRRADSQMLALHRDADATAFQDPRSTLDRHATLNVDGVSLATALRELDRGNRVSVTYQTNQIRSVRRSVTFHGTNVPLRDIFAVLLAGTGLTVREAPAGQLYIDRGASRGRREIVHEGGGVHGTITDGKSGGAIDAVSVHLEGTTLSAVTDRHGVYHILSVPPGTYTITARRIGYSAASQSVTIQAGADVAVDLVLAKSASVLDQVVVTGTVAPTEVRAVPTPVSIVSGDDMRRLGMRRVDQIYRFDVPGSIAWDEGAYDYSSSISIRGANSLLINTVKTYIDGIEVASSAFQAVDPASIDHIEVVRGPEASTIYGSDASGGVMQIFTMKGDPTLHRPQVTTGIELGDVQSAYRSGGTLRQHYAATIMGGGDGFGYNIGGSYTHVGEWVPEYFNSERSAFGSIRIVQDPLTLDLTARQSVQPLGFVVNPALAQTGFPSFSKPQDQDLTMRTQTYGAHLSYAPLATWRHSLTVGVDRFDFDQYNTAPRLTYPTDTTLSVNSDAEAKTSVAYNTTLNLAMSAAVGLQLTAGADHYDYSGTAFLAPRALNNSGTISSESSVPPIPIRPDYANTGFFGQAQVALGGALFITGGMRGERNTNFGRRAGTVWSPRVGLSYVHDVGRITLKLRGSYGEATRPPRPQQRDAQQSPSAIQEENPLLGPERQRGGDAGIEVAFHNGASLSATYYNQRAIDLIQQVIISADSFPNTIQYQNAGRIKNEGWELEGHFVLPKVLVSGNYSHVSSVVTTLRPGYTGDLKVGDQVTGIPHATAALSVMFSPLVGTRLSIGGTYVGRWTQYDYIALYKSFVDGSFTGVTRDYWTTYPAFTKLQLSARQEVTSRVVGYVTIENVTNSHAIEDNNLVVQPGRTTLIGVQLRY